MSDPETAAAPVTASAAAQPTRPRVAVITGAGGGLGRAFATALASAGWTVAALGRTRATLEETIEGLDDLSPADSADGADRADSADGADGADRADRAGAPQHLAVVCDVTDEDSVQIAFDTITDHFGRLDLLVNNAGIPGPTGRLDGVNVADFSATVHTNLTGTFLCTRAAFAWMAAHGGGRIINNGSIAAQSPRAGAAAYAASKAAVASLTVSTALDGRDVNVTATELDIGNARTELLGAFSSSEPMFDAAEAARLLVSVADLPTSVSVDRFTVTAAGMPYLGRG